MSFITPIEEATQAGFELSMVDNSLSLTPEERGKQHDQALTPVWSWTEFAATAMPGLIQLLERLADSGVDFVVIGGYAGVLHGSSPVTRDLDICAVLTPETIERLRTTLHDLHPHRMTPQALSFSPSPQGRRNCRQSPLSNRLGSRRHTFIRARIGRLSEFEGQCGNHRNRGKKMPVDRTR